MLATDENYLEPHLFEEEVRVDWNREASSDSQGRWSQGTGHCSFQGEWSGLSYSEFITELVAIWGDVWGKAREQLFEDTARTSWSCNEAVSQPAAGVMYRLISSGV